MRLLDIIISLFGLILGFPAFVIITIIGPFDTGSPLFVQRRVGLRMRSFNLIKIRTMYKNTASVATHFAKESSITPLGKILRKTNLDELPQLWNVLIGDMSLVGPRPCLPNQEELIEERKVRGVFNVKPGITGLAQVNNIDMSTPKLLAETDAKMISDMAIRKYFIYIILTIFGKGSGDCVRKD